MKEKFGKNSEASLDLKNIFIKKNDFLYADDQKINKQYLEQPKRVSCMNCLSPIGDISFIKQEIPYSICENILTLYECALCMILKYLTLCF